MYNKPCIIHFPKLEFSCKIGLLGLGFTIGCRSVYADPNILLKPP